MSNVLIEFGRKASHDDLFWIVAPALGLAVESKTYSSPYSHELIGLFRNLARLAASGGPSIELVGDVCFISTGVQTTRVLSPVASALSSILKSERYRARWPKPDTEVFGDAVARSIKLYNEIQGFLALRSLQLHQTALEEIVQAAVAVSRAAQLITKNNINMVVVATQHNSLIRAVIAAARALRRHIVYLPHAPIAKEFNYRDLPCSIALLRGPSELEQYVKIGATRSQMYVVGDPSLTSAEKVCFAKGQYLWAPSPQISTSIAAAVDVVYEVMGDAVEVCPHPRMKVTDFARTCPPAWKIHNPGPSMARIRGGCRGVIMTNSGVGIDAMLTGAPVVNLLLGGEQEVYYYLDDCQVITARNADDLKSFIKSTDFSIGASTKRAEAARRWVSAVGWKAAECAATLILKMKESKDFRFIYDGVIEALSCNEK